MKRVMFVCRKNSARSQMAEGFGKMLGAGKIAVVSSGLEGSAVRPEAIATMKAIGMISAIKPQMHSLTLTLKNLTWLFQCVAAERACQSPG